MDEGRIPVERGSGNAFEDVGLPDPEGWLRKAERMLALRRFLRRRRSSTVRAMKLLGASAQEVEALRRGRILEIDKQRVDELYGHLPEGARGSGVPAP